MHYFSGWRRADGFNRAVATAALGWLLWLLAGPAAAQTPAWVLATTGASAQAGTSDAHAIATDADGNIFITGGFSGTLVLGTTTLTSAGLRDIFVAKYVPATNTWAWAQRGGGTSYDVGYSIAVSGTSVYLTGFITNNAANYHQVQLGGLPQYGAASGVASADLVVAKYIDNGTSATFKWAQVGGGIANDYGYGIAVRNTSVYVSGFITNNAANDYATVFGGAGTTLGMLPQAGVRTTGSSADMVVVKYFDQGATAMVGWTQVAGGQGDDYGESIAVNDWGVYVIGTCVSSQTTSGSLVFGGAGLVPGTATQYGAGPYSSSDMVLAKYVDNGPSATLGWTQVAGGTGDDYGLALATTENVVYVTGHISNNRSNASQVVFGGAGTTAGTVPQYGASTMTSSDVVVAKYTDYGPTATLGWTQVAGGTGSDSGLAIAASGNEVYVAGYFTNNTTNSTAVVVGGTGTGAGTTSQPGSSTTLGTDVAVLAYLDQGPSALVKWTQIGGGALNDGGAGVALAGNRVHVVGTVYPTAVFGSLTIGSPLGGFIGFLGSLGAPGALAATQPAAWPTPRLYPNPAPGAATLSGATAGTAVHIFDALGRRVATATADATGAAPLPAGLAPGLYLVRAGAATVRWVVE